MYDVFLTRDAQGFYEDASPVLLIAHRSEVYR